MAIAVELQNQEAFYRMASDGLEGKLVGNLYPNDTILRNIGSHANATGTNGKFLLETSLMPAASYNIDIPSAQLRKLEENGYKFRIAGQSQAIFSSGENQFEVISISGKLELKLQTPLGSQESFTGALSQYAEVLTELIRGVYVGKRQAEPDFIYFLGPSGEAQASAATSTSDSGSLDALERRIQLTAPEVKFGDIGGCVSGKAEMRRIIEDILHPERAAYFGRDPQEKKGYLLLGDPGNGKTLLVKALAAELMERLNGKVRVYAVNYEDITSTFRGGEALATGKLFELVRSN